VHRALTALLLVACSSAPQRVGTQPSWRHSGSGATTTATVQPSVFAPTAEPATRYNEPLKPPPKTALGDEVIAAVQESAAQAHLPAPMADARLFRACQELAEVVPEEGVVGYTLVEFALQRNGIIEPSPHLLVVWGEVDKAAEIVDQLRPRIPEILADGASARLGVGAAKRNPDGTGAVVFALQGSGVATSPFPRALPAGGTFKLDAVVDARYRDPEVFVTHDTGETERLAVDAGRAGAFKASVSCGKHAGRQQVEIAANGDTGATVLANFPVWCGAEPPLSVAIESNRDDAPVVDASDAEKRLLALLNRDRQAAGIPALVWDDRVAAVSRAHSEEMRATKVVAHISPTTGSAADRTRAAGIKTAVVLENVARAYGVGEAHAGLMNSPGHRANIMSTTATHIGIGVVLGDEVSGRREMFVTQVFIRVPPKVDPAKAVDLVRQRLQAVRPVGVNAQLASVAQGLAEGLAAGKSRESLWPGARKKIDAMGGAFARVGSVITAVGDLETLDGKELFGEYKPDEVGIGIAQGRHPDIGEGAVWIVILMAERGSPHK
jgi:uncharacterized protein YkwD